MKKEISFGKINYSGKNKINEVTVELSLKEKEDGKVVFSACADVWNSRHTDIVSGGQILDELLPYLASNDLFMIIFIWWKKYHLNDMHAGTTRQEEKLKAQEKLFPGCFDSDISKSSYEKQCEFLKESGMYEDNGYEYGSSWLYEEIPEDILKEMRKIME